MGLRVVGPTSNDVAIAYSDGYLLRLAREHSQLEHLARATIDEIDKRRAALIAGLNDRNLTRLDADGISIRRVGRNDVSIV